MLKVAGTAPEGRGAEASAPLQGRGAFMGRIELEIYTPGYVPKGREVAVIETARDRPRGAVRREAPVTVGNFIELAAKGFYDNLKFHARKPGSVVLCGCPTTRTMGPA